MTDVLERVAHAHWGLGTVVSKLAFGRARVRFDAEPLLPRAVLRKDLTAIIETPPKSEETPPEAKETARTRRGSDALPAGEKSEVSAEALALDVESSAAWQTLEALRLGVVPAHGVRAYTVAREVELASLDALLQQERGCRVVWGDYGAGKTHLIDTAEQLALERGFATARLTLDPSENALHHPLRLYRAIVAALRTADLTTDAFESIFERVIGSPEHFEPQGRYASRFYSPYLHVLRNGDEEQIGWVRDYIRGDYIESTQVNDILRRLRWPGQNVLQLSDYRTYGRMYVHLVGTLATWCAHAGSRGLVLLFDEVERIDALRKEDQGYAFEVLKHYAAVTIQREHLAFEPESLYRGGHEVHRRLPLRFLEEQPLTMVFALTPLEEVRAEFLSITTGPEYNIHLGPLDRTNLPQLLRQIGALYRRAYDGYAVTEPTLERMTSRVAEALEDGHDSFRAGVRTAVFLFDEDRLGSMAP